jgi:hypothetical protein
VADCCCGEVCVNCPDGGTLPDSFLLVLAGFEPWFYEFNGSWTVTKSTASDPLFARFPNGAPWSVGAWRTDRLFLQLYDPVFFPNGAPVIITCNAFGGGSPFPGNAFAMGAHNSGSPIAAGWGVASGFLPVGLRTVSCNPPDVRYPAGSFGGTYPGVGAITLPNARANIISP